MFVVMCVMVITWGVLCIIDRDLIWSMYELDSRLFKNRVLRKGRNWHINMRYQGMTFILLGIIGVMTTMGYTL